MRLVVNFNKILIVSEAQRGAREILFRPGRNLLLGTNETGKSRVLKHIFWALGCEPAKRSAGGWDSNAAVLLTFSVGRTTYHALRRKKDRALFDADGQLLLATRSGARWSEEVAELFGYPLKLQRHDGIAFDFAGPEYLLLPFYIDQDASWGTKWATFQRLGQFRSWQKAVFDTFTGLKPAEYATHRFKLDELNAEKREAKARLKAHGDSFRRVAEVMPPNDVVIDESRFANELTSIEAKVKELSGRQQKLRSQLVELGGKRQTVLTQLRLARAAEVELLGDIATLAKIPDGRAIECPTCGTIHQSSFHAKLDLAMETSNIHELVVSKSSSFDQLGEEEGLLRKSLTDANEMLRRLQSQMTAGREGSSINDLVNARSHESLARVHDSIQAEFLSELQSLDEAIYVVQQALAVYESKDRESRIKEVFAEHLQGIGDELAIDRSELGTRLRIGQRPPSTGSSGPRAILATHLALMATNGEFGSGPFFPFVVDTPQQSGQDPANLRRMVDAVFSPRFATGQTLLAAEMHPADLDTSGLHVLTFDRKRQLLTEHGFNDYVRQLAPFIQEMTDDIAEQLVIDDDEDEEPPAESEDSVDDLM